MISANVVNKPQHSISLVQEVPNDHGTLYHTFKEWYKYFLWATTSYKIWLTATQSVYVQQASQSIVQRWAGNKVPTLRKNAASWLIHPPGCVIALSLTRLISIDKIMPEAKINRTAEIATIVAREMACYIHTAACWLLIQGWCRAAKVAHPNSAKEWELQEPFGIQFPSQNKNLSHIN